MMPWNDNEFSDCEVEDTHNESDEQQPATPHFPTQLRSATPPPCSWSSTLTPITIDAFTSSAGPTVQVSESPSEVFQLLFTPIFIDSIVEQNNLHAKEVMGNDKYSSWEKITSEELKAYFSFCIVIGINRLPAVDDYWSSDQVLHSRQDSSGSVPGDFSLSALCRQ